MFFKIFVFLGFHPMEWSKNVMLEHGVFLTIHRLNLEEYEDFEKHYFVK